VTSTSSSIDVYIPSQMVDALWGGWLQEEHHISVPLWGALRLHLYDVDGNITQAIHCIVLCPHCPYLMLAK